MAVERSTTLTGSSWRSREIAQVAELSDASAPWRARATSDQPAPAGNNLITAGRTSELIAGASPYDAKNVGRLLASTGAPPRAASQTHVISADPSAGSRAPPASASATASTGTSPSAANSFGSGI